MTLDPNKQHDIGSRDFSSPLGGNTLPNPNNLAKVIGPIAVRSAFEAAPGDKADRLQKLARRLLAKMPT
jgi:hypothetical protein